jgi:uncharacterized protein YacL
MLKKVKKSANYAKERVEYIREKFKEHASTAIIAALSFLIALSWRDFIVKLVKENVAISSLSNYPYLAELYTAIIVTIIAIIAISIVSKWAQKPEQNSKNN